jgi:hypothetical protein
MEEFARTCEDDDGGGEGAAAARWVRENPSEVKKLSPEAN